MQNKYKEDKEIVLKKSKKIKLIYFIFISIIMLLVLIISCNIKLIKDDNHIIDADVIANTEDNADLNNNESNTDLTIEDNPNYIDGISDEENTEQDIEDNNANDINTEDKKEFVYGEKVPENEAVLDDYFDDAVFIGNSQIEGISIYSSMKNATFFAGKGIMVDTIFTKEVVKTTGGSRITIMDALAKEQFGKVYIMLGANELGWAYDYLFIEQYGKVIDEIKQLQPDARIYINGIMPVSEDKSNNDTIYNNKNIDNYNNLILNMTKEKEVYYIDSKEALADEDGNLPKDASTDGVHFNATYYEKWFNYLKTHTVN